MRKILLCFQCALLMMGCANDTTEEEIPAPEKPDKEIPGLNVSLRGSVQKGQYTKGASVMISLADENLNLKGQVFPTQVLDNMGTFSVNSLPESRYADLEANGYYLNEVTGKISESPLTLRAIADLENPDGANVNILTSLEYFRIKKLVKEGKSFSDARKQAEEEVLRIFGIDYNEISGSFGEMNISKEGKRNAVLLAVSVVLQQGRTPGELSSLVANLALDIEDDGVVSGNQWFNLKESSQNIDRFGIAVHMLDYYREQQVTAFNIPAFFQYIDHDGNGNLDGEEPLFLTSLDNMLSTGDGSPSEGETIKVTVLSNIDFSVECENGSAVKTELADNLTEVAITLDPNDGGKREIAVNFRDAGNKIVQTLSFNQQSFLQTLYIVMGIGNNGSGKSASNFEDEVKINVNGTIYTPRLDTGTDAYYVEVPKAKFYRVCYPAEYVEPSDDPYSCTVNYPANPKDQFAPFYYGCLNPSAFGSTMGNPARVIMKPCCSHLELRTDLTSDLACVILRCDGGILSAKATYSIYDDPAYPIPSYTAPEPVFENPSSEIRIDFAKASWGGFNLYPQTLHNLTIELYDKNDKLISTKGPLDITCDIGKQYNIFLGE